MKLTRNRIVIPLDKARADEPGRVRVRVRRSGRAGRVLGFIAIILVVVIIGALAGGYFWWRHYQSQPAYSLALLVDAAQRNDDQNDRDESDRKSTRLNSSHPSISYAVF